MLKGLEIKVVIAAVVLVMLVVVEVEARVVVGYRELEDRGENIRGQNREQDNVHVPLVWFVPPCSTFGRLVVWRGSFDGLVHGGH